MPVSTIDPNIITTLVATAVSVLYSFVKPESLSHEMKKKISILLAVGAGVGVAFYTGRTSAFDFVAYVTMAAGVMQGFYVGIMEKLGAEGVIRTSRSLSLGVVNESMHRVAEATKVLVHNSSPSPLPQSSSKEALLLLPFGERVKSGLEEINQAVKDWKNRLLSDDAVATKVREIRARYGEALPPFPGNYPLA